MIDLNIIACSLIFLTWNKDLNISYIFMNCVQGVPKKRPLVRRDPISLRGVFSGTPCMTIALLSKRSLSTFYLDIQSCQTFKVKFKVLYKFTTLLWGCVHCIVETDSWWSRLTIVIVCQCHQLYQELLH